MIEKKLPIILMILFVFCYFCAPSLPVNLKSFFYALSLSIKEILLFSLPFIIFAFLFEGLVSLRSTALKFIAFILPAIFLSGFAALQIAYFFGKYLFLKHDALAPFISSGTHLYPLWEFTLPRIISINVTLLIAVILGIFMPIINTQMSHILSKFLAKTALFFLRALFIPIIPLFIFGFLLRISHEGHLDMIVRDYSWILLYIIVLGFCYITLLYLISCNFNLRKTTHAIKDMIPAMITGFSTMSSAMAMPFLIEAAQKNVPNPETVRATIPLAINPHLLGDAISISLFSFAIMISFGYAFPSFETYLMFSLYLLISKFGVAGIPGGGIIVLAPVLGEHLGFDSTMTSLITAIYILFDPFITAGNIYGNGAFSMLFCKFFEKRK